MKIIVCLDQRNGMLFNKRRQSADKAVYRRIMELICGEKLWMNGYSAPLFEGLGGNICTSENYIREAGENAYSFVEDLDISAYAREVSEVLVFRWNRIYPAELYFPEMLLTDPWKLAEKYEFVGNSHDLITQEVYRR